ncbi:MAG: STAS domain-containing protein [Planctomycetota bacterium]|jgi:anti-sigma B factor antagonist
MEVTSHQLDGAVKVVISGEVDMHNSAGVREELLAAVEKKPPLIIVDLSAVAYIDSSGLATLVECLQNLTDYGGRLVLVGASKSARDVFSIARLDKVFSFCDSEEEALADR